MKHVTTVMTLCALFVSACGSSGAPSFPGNSGDEIQDVNNSEKKKKGANAERNTGEKGLLSVETDIQTENDPDEIGSFSDSAPLDENSSRYVASGEDITLDDAESQNPTQALTVTTLRKRFKNVRAYVQSGKGQARELLWPNEADATAANEGFCFKGRVTEITFKIYSEDRGDLAPGSEEVGILKASADSIEIGFEEDGCGGDRCQDDNIIRLHCADGIKLAGPAL